MLYAIGGTCFSVALLGCVFCIFWYHRFRGGHLFAAPVAAVLCPIMVTGGDSGSATSTLDILAIAVPSGLLVLFPIVYGGIALYRGSTPWVTEGKGSEYVGEARVVKYARVPLTGSRARRYWLAIILLPVLQTVGWACVAANVQMDRWRDEARRAERKTELLGQLEGADGEKRFQAARNLALAYTYDLQPDDEAKILQVLRSDLARATPADKRQAIGRVADLKAHPEAVVQLLRAAMQDADPETRCAAIRSLAGRVPREHAKVTFDEIIALARGEPDAMVRQEAVLAVMSIDNALYEKEFKQK